MKNKLLTGLAGLVLTAGAQAQDAAVLGVGDPAPALSVAEWVKGSQVSEFETGKVYIVEFWATWCGPCIASMPHLSELQREHPDLTIIGMTSEDPGNSLEQVKKMVADKGDGMGYTVAWDTERQTNEAYMKAANQPGIPTSFLIDGDGKIAYIGHPMTLDIPLSMVLDGSWDYVKGPALLKQIDADRRDIYINANEDPKRALELLTKFRADYPAADQGFDGVHFTILAQLPEHAAEAEKLGGKIVAAAIAEKSVQSLNGFAWGLVDPEAKHENRFLDLALRAAAKASELSGGKDPAVLDTLARVHFWRGDLELALTTQRLAVEHAQGGMQESLQKAVTEYEQALAAQTSN